MIQARKHQLVIQSVLQYLTTRSHIHIYSYEVVNYFYHFINGKLSSTEKYFHTNGVWQRRYLSPYLRIYKKLNVSMNCALERLLVRLHFFHQQFLQDYLQIEYKSRSKLYKFFSKSAVYHCLVKEGRRTLRKKSKLMNVLVKCQLQ